MLFPFIPFFIGINLFAGNRVLPDSDRTESESNQTEIVSQKRILNEKILLFDGSELTGNLIRLDKRKNLFWQNESVADPISFNYRSISSINFDRSVTPLKQIPHDRKSLRLYFKNGDKLSCEFEQLTKEHLIIKSKFSERLSIPTSDIQKLEFLPISHQTLYDPSLGLQNWQKSNSKSWIIEDTDFVSVFSGSIGTTLPKKTLLKLNLKLSGKDPSIWQCEYFRIQTARLMAMKAIIYHSRIIALTFKLIKEKKVELSVKQSAHSCSMI